jgi:hypothetical protein
MDPQEHDDVVNLLKIPFQKYRPPMFGSEEEIESSED